MKPPSLPHTFVMSSGIFREKIHILLCFFFVLDRSSIMAMEITMAQIPTAGATQRLNQTS
jgi:hypothetical protein